MQKELIDAKEYVAEVKEKLFYIRDEVTFLEHSLETVATCLAQVNAVSRSEHNELCAQVIEYEGQIARDRLGIVEVLCALRQVLLSSNMVDIDFRGEALCIKTPHCDEQKINEIHSALQKNLSPQSSVILNGETLTEGLLDGPAIDIEDSGETVQGSNNEAKI